MRGSWSAAVLWLFAVPAIGCGDDDGGAGEGEGEGEPCAAPEGILAAVVRPLDSVDEAFRWELNDVACWDDANCVAVGTTGRILVTVDGGDVWEQVSDGGGGFAAVACPRICATSAMPPRTCS